MPLLWEKIQWKSRLFWLWGNNGNFPLAFFFRMYYTIQTPRRCDEMVDVADSKSAAGYVVPVRVWGARGAPPVAE